MATAIVGLACIFPGAPDLGTFWRNIVSGVDAISEVPPARWDPSFYDPHSTAIDRFYCKRGGFIDDYATFDPLQFGVVPKAAAGAEPDQLLTLRVGYDALVDAGYGDKPFARARTGVIVGRGNYVSAGVLKLEQHVRLLPQILQTLTDLFPDLPPEALDAARARLSEQFSYYGPDVAIGLIPNLIASRLANRLDLRGPAYTVDAACASSLIAVEQACASLARGETDMMLVGGVHLSHDLTFWATFCQLGALSRSGIVRPFAENADGILAGEGVGMAVLKRLDDALADGDRIYAVIEGAGSASDGQSATLLAPAVAGQSLALERAWSSVPFDRAAIGLLEAHGTGTPTGDTIEIETIRQFFGPATGDGGKPVVGSVKSMIGHAMPASGMASLIKTALSIHHGILPPTLHCEQPNPKLAETSFRVIDKAEPWQQGVSERVGAINAFGFGGINAHIVLRGFEMPPPEVSPLLPVLMLGGDRPEDILVQIDAGAPYPAPHPNAAARLVVLAPDERKLATARKAVASGKPWNGRQQIWFSPRGLLAGGGKLAFVFPGVDSTFKPRATDLADYFGKPLPAHCEAMDPQQSLARVVAGLMGFNRYLFEILTSLGIKPAAIAGHSVGEWSAMLASGMMDQTYYDQAHVGVDLDKVEFPDVVFLAASCDLDRLMSAMDGLDRIGLSHDNCPHQVIACGARDVIEILSSRLKAASVFHNILPIVSGFHSPLFRDYMQWYRDFFNAADLREPTVPVWSATTARPFPEDQTAKRQLAQDHLLEPVRFRSLIETMYEAGTHVFVEVGTGSLTGFIDDTLTGRPHHAIRSNHEDRTGLAQLQYLSAALWVEGASFDLQLLTGKSEAPNVVRPISSRPMKLDLGVPLVRIAEPLELALQPVATASIDVPVAANDPVGQLVQDTLADIQRTSREILAAWQQHRSKAVREMPRSTRPVSARFQRVLDVDSTIPYVKDHELYPQREGWPIVADRHPVVPMTMEVMLVREAVEEAMPGLKVIELFDIQAYNWLAVASPVAAEISLESLDADTITAEIIGYFRARVRVSVDYPVPDLVRPAPLIRPRATEIDPVELYQGRWMFHGPAYQGVVAFRGIGENGIDGTLQVPSGKGALLDNMGQLAGYWVMEQPENCLAMPVGVDRIRFFAPDPVVGETLEADVRVVELDALNCVTNHQLRDAGGIVRVAIEGWRTRRYQMDKAFWVSSRLLSELSVSQPIPPNVVIFEDRYDTAILRDYLSRRYLTAAERETYESQSPRRRRQWLSGRIAAKDAVLTYLRRERGLKSVFPQELRIENDARGAPHIQPNVTDSVPLSLHISLTHKGNLAAAIVGEAPVGIDIERIEVRDEGFITMAFTAHERLLLRGEDDATAYTRGWVAKEVIAKADGTGLRGNPKDFIIESREGDCLRVNGKWVVTHQLHDCIIGWSFAETVLTDAVGRTSDLSEPSLKLGA